MLKTLCYFASLIVLEVDLLTVPKIRKIVLNSEHVRMMFKAAKKEYPKEACGVILGQFRTDVAEAQELVPAKNVADSTTRFMIDVEELYKILIYADEAGKEMVGVFHSHPTVVEPSSIDKPFMEINPIVWVIVGTSGEANIAAYQWFNGRIHPVEIIVKDV